MECRNCLKRLVARMSLPSRSYSLGGESGGPQIRSATAAGERQTFSYNVRSRGI